MSKRPARPTSFLLALIVACAPAEAVVVDTVESAGAAGPPTPAAGGVHPLQRWMESELMPRLRGRDFSRLARALTVLSEIAPPEYPGWARIAAESAVAAERHDLEAVRRGCASCHQLYRSRYRTAPIHHELGPLIERSRR